MYCEFEQKKRRTCKNTSDPNKDPDQNCEIRNKKCYTRKIKNKPKIKMTRKKDKKDNMLLGFTIGVVSSYALWVNFGRKMVKNKKY